MVKTITKTTYMCEVCQRPWDKLEDANQCEADTPKNMLTPGDVVLWRGRRDNHYGVYQTLVYDLVESIDFSGRLQPGHFCNYRLKKQYSIFHSSIFNARSGYLNWTGIGHSPLHSDRLGTALREANEEH